ncbi:MAG: MarR family transcriptional regulator [Acinetobacter sp.]
MIETLGKTQQNLLHALQAHKSGLTMDTLADVLHITRTAVRQHIAALEIQGFVEKGQTYSSGGRPSQFYQLTHKGFDLFPKQYALFSTFLLDAINSEKGNDGLSDWLHQLGNQVAQNFKHKTIDDTLQGRLIKTVNVMNTLAYDAYVDENQSKQDEGAIEAVNCIYHDLAARHPQVCQFDLALLANLTDSKVIHKKCIQKGDSVCRFCFIATPSNSNV